MSRTQTPRRGDARDPAGPSRSRWRRAARWASYTGVSLVVYFFLAARLELTELVVGVLVAGFGGAAVYAVLAEEHVRVRPSLRELAQARKIPRALVVESWGVLVVLVRHLFTKERARSLVLAAPFEHGDEADARASARRALAVVYTSTTPRAIAFDFDEERGVVLYHLLEPGPVPAPLEALKGDE